MKKPINILRGISIALCLAGTGTAVSAGQSERMEYNITWVGISVGTMVVKGGTDEAGTVTRSVRIWNRPWIAAIYPVDTTLECVIEQTPEGARHSVFKKVSEKDFVQDDTLVLFPDTGKAVWSNAVDHTLSTSTVPKGSRDLVSFFFDLRDTVTEGPLKVDGDYQLVMDGSIHALEISIGKAKKIRTPHGRIEAIPVKAISKSPTLFSRNRPRAVWVATAQPAVLFADVQTRFGAVRGTLVKWEVDGEEIKIKN